MAELIALATQARRMGKTESDVLSEASDIRPLKRAGLEARVAKGNYFIGSCLVRRDPSAAIMYFRKALDHDPWHWRARLRWLQLNLLKPGKCSR